MSTVVEVAGGTGKLGRTIVESLMDSWRFTVLVLGRETTATSTLSLSPLEEHKIDTLISTLGSSFGIHTELALIKAADMSTATKRYIPSTWGLKYTSEVAATFSLTQGKIDALEALGATSLEFTATINGFFLDYYVAPHVKSYLRGLALAIDIANKAAVIPGSGNVPVVFTYSFDIGKSVAALLTQLSWKK